MLVFLSIGCLSSAEWFHHLQTGFWTGRLINPWPLEASLWQLTSSWECSWLEMISRCPESGFGQSTIYEWDAWARHSQAAGWWFEPSSWRTVIHSILLLPLVPGHCTASLQVLRDLCLSHILLHLYCSDSGFTQVSTRVAFMGLSLGTPFSWHWVIPKDPRGCTHFQTDGLCNMLGVGDVNPQPVKWPSCVLLS